MRVLHLLRPSAKRALRALLLGVGVLAASVVFYEVIWQLPIASVAPNPLLSERERQQLILESRKTNAQIIVGAVLLVGLYFTWRNVRVVEEGKNTERFTKAVDQLSGDKIEQRVGGINALERLAADSRRDHAAILELLCAFLRHRERTPEEAQPRVPVGTPPHVVKMLETNRMMDEVMGWAPSAPEDVKAAAGVIRRQKFRFEHPHVLDLSNADLRRVRLDGARLAGSNLFGIFGQHLTLKDADLGQADLSYAELKMANLDRANLRGARISGTHFDFAYLRKADLRGARIIEKPEYEVEGDPDIDRIIEEGPSVHFVFADLRDARIEGLDLRRADMRDADLSTAVGLTYKQIEHTIGNKGTKLPPGIDRPPTWLADSD